MKREEGAGFRRSVGRVGRGTAYLPEKGGEFVTVDSLDAVERVGRDEAVVLFKFAIEEANQCAIEGVGVAELRVSLVEERQVLLLIEDGSGLGRLLVREDRGGGGGRNHREGI